MPSPRPAHIFLCTVPLFAIPLAAVRPLRIPGLHHTIGAALFLAIAAAAWVMTRQIKPPRLLAVAGLLFISPFALIALLWVGIGPPWEATLQDNLLRYLVLLAASIAVTVAFILLKDGLATSSPSGDPLHSSLASAVATLAGAAYLIWLTFKVGAYAARIHNQTPPTPPIESPTLSTESLALALDTLLFIACVLTYLATAAGAAALGRAGFLGRAATRICITFSLLGVALLTARGLSFPDPNAGGPWYTRPGLIAGIPAIPWIMPYYFGVALLRRAGQRESLRPND